MAQGDAQRIRQYLCRQVDLARERGDRIITFRAGDVHATLGLKQRMPNVCQVLKGRTFLAACRVEVDRIVSSPLSGQGANLVMQFRI